MLLKEPKIYLFGRTKSVPPPWPSLHCYRFLLKLSNKFLKAFPRNGETMTNTIKFNKTVIENLDIPEKRTKFMSDEVKGLKKQ